MPFRSKAVHVPRNDTRRLFVGVLLMCAITSCDSARSESENEWWGEAAALRNDEQWVATPLALHPKRGGVLVPAADSFFLALYTFWPDGTNKEALSFGLLPRKKGMLSLPPLSEENAFSTHVVYHGLDHDAVTDEYVPDPVASNWIVVEHYDAAMEEVRGRFQVTLLPDLKTPSAPDTLRFTQGSFRTVILDEWPDCPSCVLQ